MPPTSDRNLFDLLASLTTEARNPRSRDLDLLSTGDVLRLIHEEDRSVAEAVERELPAVERAVELVIAALAGGGRLIYVGAGTSGRLGVLDAAECPPTFGSDPEQVRGVVAGGPEALVRAVEGAEDDSGAGIREMQVLEVGPGDVVFGIAASRRTPFTVAAVAEARRRGARTVYLSMNPPEGLEVDVAVCPVVGPEVLTGSTRMKAALAQKMVLTMVTTTAFVRLGAAYENMMVDLVATNAKLRERARRTVMLAAGVEYEAAGEALERAGGSVKTALVMLRAGVEAEEARRRLARAAGSVRRAVANESEPGAGAPGAGASPPGKGRTS